MMDTAKRDRLDARDRILVPVLLSGNVLGVMLIAVVNPALGSIAEHFAAETPNAFFLARIGLTLPGICIALASPLAGFLADRWGRRPLFLASILFYGLAGASCAVAPSIWALLAGRLAQGVAAAGIVNACAVLVADYYAGAARERVIGWQSAAISGGAVLFLLLSGLVAALDWRAVFWLFVAAALVAFVAVYGGVSEPRIAQTGSGGKPPRASAGIWGVALLGGATATMMFMPTIHIPFLFAEHGITDPRLIGLALAALSLTGATAALFYERLHRALGTNGVFTLVFSVAAIGTVLIALVPVFAGALAGLAIFGVGVGLMLPNIMSVAFRQSDDLSRAKAVAFVNTAMFIGESSCPFVTEPIRLWVGETGLFLASASLLTAIAIATPVIGMRSRSPRIRIVS